MVVIVIDQQTKLWFLRIAEALSVGRNSLVEDSHLYHFPAFQTVILLSEAVYLRIKAVFYAYRIFT